jgi:acetylornithine deacetylase/succinyl-diaminopimelate desuccinylase-like protein
VVILIEASEESGSPDLPVYMASLSSRIGSPGLVITLDSTCGNYDQLWVTTSLRSMLIGDIKVKVLEQGVHSGTAEGVVTSSFRVLRPLISRFENEMTGEISPSFLNEQIPKSRRQRAAALHHGKICPAPNGCEITIDWQEPNAGWHAPETTPALEASLQKASQAYFGAPAMYLSCGDSIPMLTVPMSFCISPPPRRSPPALPHCFTTGDKGRGYRLLACQRLARC